MRASTTRTLKDSRGNEVPAGAEIHVERMPKGPDSVVAGKLWGGRRYVAVDQWSCEPLGAVRR